MSSRIRWDSCSRKMYFDMQRRREKWLHQCVSFVLSHVASSVAENQCHRLAALCIIRRTLRALLRVVLHILSACGGCGAGLLFLCLQAAESEGVLGNKVLELLERFGSVLGDVEIAIVRRDVQGHDTVGHAPHERGADVEEWYVREAASERLRVAIDLRIEVVQ